MTTPPSTYTEGQVCWQITRSPLSLSSWGTLAGGIVSFIFAFKSEQNVQLLHQVLSKECSWDASKTLTCITLNNQKNGEQTQEYVLLVMGTICLLASTILFAKLCCQPHKYPSHRQSNGAIVYTSV